MKRVFKWIGLSVLGLLLLVLGGTYLLSAFALNKEYRVKVTPITIPTDSFSIERGRHIATAMAKCGDCHGKDLGGKVMVDDMPMVGKLWAANLTRGKGSAVADYNDEDWVRAIRHGVGKDGKSLLVMPAQEYWHHDDEELGAIIAYIKSVPPVDREIPDWSVGPLFRFLYLAGQIPLLPAEMIDHEAPRPPVPVAGPTAEYGKHMVTTGGCASCHGPGFSGGPVPGMPPDFPPASNITTNPTEGIGSWTEADFVRALREGKRPNGTMINKAMPWEYTAMLSDDEIRALWLYLRTVPPAQTGNR